MIQVMQFCEKSFIYSGIYMSRAMINKSALELRMLTLDWSIWLRAFCSLYEIIWNCPAGTQRRNNVDSTLIQRQDVESTLNRRCLTLFAHWGVVFNVVLWNQWSDFMTSLADMDLYCLHCAAYTSLK